MTTEPASGQRPRWRIFPAVAIIAIGVLFLANNLGYRLDFFVHGNWWALFILAAALAPLARAWEIYRADQRMGAEVAYHLLVALAAVLVAVMFLAGLAWRTWWPLFVILGGLYALLPRRSGRRPRDWHRTSGADEDATFRR